MIQPDVKGGDVVTLKIPESIEQQEEERFMDAETEFENTDPEQITFEKRPAIYFPGTKAAQPTQP